MSTTDTATHTPTGTLLSAAGITKAFGSQTAVDQVDLTLGRGIVGVLGPNGAGKTTLLRILATVLAPDRGTLSLLGLDPAHPTARTEVRRRLGYLPQSPRLYGGFTPLEMVDYVAILKEHTDASQRRREAVTMLEAVGLGDAMHKRIRTLSGGMQQRVALASALVGAPDLLVLDEPATGLDPEQRIALRSVLAETAHRGLRRAVDAQHRRGRGPVPAGPRHGPRQDLLVRHARRAGGRGRGPGLGVRRRGAHCAAIVADRPRHAPPRGHPAGRGRTGRPHRGRRVPARDEADAMNTALAQAALPNRTSHPLDARGLPRGRARRATVLARSAGGPADVVLAIAAAGLAATVVAGLHDPAAAMLAPVPVSVMQRRVLRLAVVLLPALVVWAALNRVAEAARGDGLPRAAARPAAAASRWRCGRRRTGTVLGASAPVLWFALDMACQGRGPPPTSPAGGDRAGRGGRRRPGLVVAGRRR